MMVQRKKRFANVLKRQCVACGSCVRVCPKGALQVVNGSWAEADREKCVGCGLCAAACPASVIVIERAEREETGYED